MLGFFRKNNNEIEGEWRTVAELKVGQSIAVPKDAVLERHNSPQSSLNLREEENRQDNDILWDEIESIEYKGAEQVWDIEVEGTHNFVGNNIFAHNTYITGNVGAGTSTPYAKLSAAGGDTTTTLIAADALTGFTGNLLDLKVASTSKFTVDYTGAITTGGSLTLSGAAINSILSTNSTGAIVATSTPTFGNFNATSTNATSTIAGGLNIENGGFVYDYSSGNVGIGTASPAAKLDVQGPALFGAGDYTGGVYIGAGGWVYGIGAQYGSAADDGALRLNPAGYQAGYDYFRDLLIYNGKGAQIGMFDGSSGNFGVGAGTPTARLTLDGMATGAGTTFGTGEVYLSDSNQYFDFDNGMVFRGTGGQWATRFTGASSMDPSGQIVGIYKEETGAPYTNDGGDVPGQGIIATFNNDGFVGIGTSSPFALLQLSSTTASATFKPQLALSDYSAGANLKHWTLSSQGGNFYIASSTDAYATTTGMSALTILNNGNVGIGTTNPSGAGLVVDTKVGETYAMFGQGSEAGVSIIGGGNSNIGFNAYFNGEWKSMGGGYGGFIATNDTTGDLYIYTTNSAAASDDSSIGSSLVQRFVINSAGNVGIGTTTPISTLSVQGSLCVRDTGSCGTAAGTIYATNATVQDIDLAENYPTLDKTIEAGDLVMLDVANPVFVAKARPGTGTSLIGVVSTKPGLLFGYDIDYENVRPVALVGRVPVKVNLEGGEIKIGDKITLSSTTGVGMKATVSGETVGVALEDYDSEEVGKILVFVNLGWSNLDSQIADETILELAAAGMSQTGSGQTSSSPPLSLESIMDSLNALASSTASTIDKLAFDIADLGSRVLLLEAGTTSISLLFSNPEGLTIEAPLTLNGGLRVDRIASINDYLSLMSDTEFIGRPYFTKDTAGFAVIRQGSREVEIAFEREYLEQPIVNATISFEAASSTATSAIPVGGGDVEEQIFSNDVRFLVTEKSERGFTILLNKPAPVDVPFGWNTFAVKSPKLFSSIPTSEPVSTVIISPDIAPTIDASTTTSEIIPTPESISTTTAETTASEVTESAPTTEPEPIVEPDSTSSPQAEPAVVAEPVSAIP